MEKDKPKDAPKEDEETPKIEVISPTENLPAEATESKEPKTATETKDDKDKKEGKDGAKKQQGSSKQRSKNWHKSSEHELYEQLKAEQERLEEEMRSESNTSQGNPEEEDVEHFYNLQLIFPEPYFEELEDREMVADHDWPFVIQVNFKTFGDVTCPICLLENQEMIVPHMAFCGHIMCLPCALQLLKSSKTCPMCKATIAKADLKFTNILTMRRPEVGDEITLIFMKFMQESRRLEPQNHSINFSQQTKLKKGSYNQPNKSSSSRSIDIDNPHIDRLSYILCINQKQHQMLLEKQLTSLHNWENMNPDSPLVHEIVPEAIGFILEEADSYFDQSGVLQHFHSARDRLDVPMDYSNSGDEFESKQIRKRRNSRGDRERFFYQSEAGAACFLHDLCFRYLRSAFNDKTLPLEIKGKVLYVEEVVQTKYTRRDLKYLKHLPNNADLYFVKVDLSKILSKTICSQLDKEFEQLVYNTKLQKEKKEIKDQEFYSASLSQREDSDYSSYHPGSDRDIGSFVKTRNDSYQSSELDSEGDFPSLGNTFGQQANQVDEEFPPHIIKIQKNPKKNKKGGK